jgi:hypothetical protein
MANLSIFYSFSNLVGGRVSEFYDLPALRDIRIQFSRFEGSLTSSIGLLTNLTFFFCHFARVTGTLPSQLGLLTGLSFLAIENPNGMGGTIPSELSRLTRLSQLYLRFSNYSGSLPSLRGMPNLTICAFEDNPCLDCSRTPSLCSCGSQMPCQPTTTTTTATTTAAPITTTAPTTAPSTALQSTLAGTISNPSSAASTANDAPLSSTPSVPSVLAPSWSSYGAVIGGAVAGGVAFLAIAGALLFFFCRKSNDPPSTGTTAGTTGKELSHYGQVPLGASQREYDRGDVPNSPSPPPVVGQYVPIPDAPEGDVPNSPSPIVGQYVSLPDAPGVAPGTNYTSFAEHPPGTHYESL